MIEMKELEREKREELCKGVAQLGIKSHEARKLLEFLEDKCIIEIIPPKKEESPLQMVRIQATRTGKYRGKTYKPGNIILNIKDAISDALILGSSTLASMGSISISEPKIAILTIFAAILSAVNLSKIILDDNAVVILAVLWENRYTYDSFIDVKVGLELVNNYLELHNREKLSEVQYNDLLEDLESVKSIVLDNGKIKLNEKIYIQY